MARPDGPNKNRKPKAAGKKTAGKKAKPVVGKKPKAWAKAKPKPNAAKKKHRKGTRGPTDEQMQALPSERKPKEPMKPATKRPLGDKPKRTFGEKSKFARGEKPQRKFGDKPKFGEKPKRPYGDRPARPSGDKPTFGEKPAFGDKPRRAQGEKPFGRTEKPWEKREPSFKKPYGKKPYKGGKSSKFAGKKQDDKVFEPKKMPTLNLPPVDNAFSALDGVHPRTAAALAKAGATAPFPIQAAVIPKAVRGSDMLVQSPTGSGKTYAFGVPIVEQLKAETSSPSALVLVPTRELAIQVSEDLLPIARGKNIDVVAVYGGAPIEAQARRASRAGIVVATPGRLADLMRTRRINVGGVNILILDEADRMLDMGFQPQVDEIVEKLSSRRQTMLFSATLEGPVAKIAEAYTVDPEIVRNDKAVGDGHKIEHVMLATTTKTKVDTVLDALASEDRDLAVVFVRTQRGAERLCERLRTFGIKSTTIHGGMNQGQRNREYRRFQAGTCDTLVATDVFARGMDLDRITHVINYDMPEDADTYQHRTGRTGRAGRTGTAITMVLPNQTKTIKAMVKSVGLPSALAERLTQSSGKRWKQVPEGERFVDRPNADRGNRGGPGKAGDATSGTIASYDEEKGFGFIKPNSGSVDVFFHRSALVSGSSPTISRGASVSFELDETSDRGRAAIVQINGLGGANRSAQMNKRSGARPNRSRGKKQFSH